MIVNRKTLKNQFRNVLRFIHLFSSIPCAFQNIPHTQNKAHKSHTESHNLLKLVSQIFRFKCQKETSSVCPKLTDSSQRSDSEYEHATVGKILTFQFNDGKIHFFLIFFCIISYSEFLLNKYLK